MDIVSKKLSKMLNIDNIVDDKKIEESVVSINPLTNQPIYSSSLITDQDISMFRAMETDLGLADFSKIILMKVAQKSLNDHDELIEIMGKIDDKSAARISEVAQQALGNASDASKALLNFTLQKEKMEIEKQKLEIKSVTINNLNMDQPGIKGTQKEILDQIKHMMNPNSDYSDDDVPPLIGL